MRAAAPDSSWTASPLFLLIATGSLLGASLPVARVGATEGWTPVSFVFATSLAAGLLLLVLHARHFTRRPGLLQYSLICGVLSIAVPNSLTFIVLPRLGTGFAATLYTLPPLLTYLFAWVVGMERFHAVRLSGILVGLGGAVLLALTRGAAGDAQAVWFLLALGVPVSIAAGNVYRKLRLPDNVNAGILAAGMLLGGAASLAPLVLGTRPFWPGTPGAGLIALAQCLLISLTFVVYFRFQRVADPIYFSQMGYVVSAVGILAGILLSDERFSAGLAMGMGLIVVGITLVNRTKRASISD